MPDTKVNPIQTKPTPAPVVAPKSQQGFVVECKWARKVVRGVKVKEKEGLHSCMRDTYEVRLELHDPDDSEVLPRVFLEVQSLEPVPFREKEKYKVTLELVKE